MPPVPSKLREQIIHIWDDMQADEDVQLYRDVSAEVGEEAMWWPLMKRVAADLGRRIDRWPLGAEEWCRELLRKGSDDQAWELIRASVWAIDEHFRTISYGHDVAGRRAHNQLNKRLAENGLSFEYSQGDVVPLTQEGLTRTTEPTKTYAEATELIGRAFDRVFDLPSPSDMPPVVTQLDPGDREIIERYLKMCGELMASTALRSGAEVTISMGGPATPPGVRGSFPSTELIRGLAPLFRQLYEPDEEASFQKAMNIAQRAVQAAPDGDTAERRRQLSEWGKAAGRLRGKSLDDLVPEALGWPGAFGTRPSPQEVISAHFYGGLIHWGDKKQTLEEWSSDPGMAAMFELRFLQVVQALGHIYVLFGQVLCHLFTPDGL